MSLDSPLYSRKNQNTWIKRIQESRNNQKSKSSQLIVWKVCPQKKTFGANPDKKRQAKL